MKVVLFGYGKMGKAIEQVALRRNHEILFTIESSDQKEVSKEYLSKADVAIEFSTPSAAYGNIIKCFDADLPVVVGTTGWLNKFEAIEKICNDRKQAFFWASNFSIGMNIVFELNNKLARWMNGFPGYDVSIEETHHTQKLDSPSGTAITLAEGIIKNIDRKTSWVNHAANRSSDLEIFSVRKEHVPGIHAVKYASDFDDIVIKHTAHSREGFATGAVIAAEWLKDKKGVFGMKDLLNLN